jgi:hypothetical protein
MQEEIYIFKKIGVLEKKGVVEELREKMDESVF